MNDLEKLKYEKGKLEIILQSLIHENLTSKQVKEENTLEYNMLLKQEKEIDDLICDLKSKMNKNGNDYSYNKENKLFNKIIGANLIPCLSVGALLIGSGNSQVISNMGIFSSIFTGIPTLVVSTGIYISKLKDIRKGYKNEYFNSKECSSYNDELKKLEGGKLSIHSKIHDLRVEINKSNTSIQTNACKIVSIKNRIASIDFALKNGNLVIEQEESVNLTK